jgi:nucleotide-binding universal stress UspA family protein
MFKKIILPVDLTNKHQAALTLAADLAGQGGEITLLHVIELIPGLPPEEEQDFYGRLEKAARTHLQHLATVLQQKNVRTVGEVIIGNRTREVARYAGQSGADLIVLTSPRLDIDNPGPGWGSLSWKIALVAPCPVLLAK